MASAAFLNFPQENEALQINPLQKYGKNTNVLDIENTRPINGTYPAMQLITIELMSIMIFPLPLQK